jgi:hypothetical protein
MGIIPADTMRSEGGSVVSGPASATKPRWATQRGPLTVMEVSQRLGKRRQTVRRATAAGGFTVPADGRRSQVKA